MLTFSMSHAQNPLGFALDNGVESVELSFIRESNLIIVPIKLNGQGPFNFILDTGSESGMVFEKWVIGENNLVDARTVPVYAADGNKVTDLLVASNLNVRLEGVNAEHQSMLVLQEDYIDIKNVIGMHAHGILGSEIFNRFVVEIDYERKILKLTDPTKFKRPRGYKRYKISIENFRPFIEAKIKQKKNKTKDVKLLIDTGASSALFLDAEKYDDIYFPKKTINHTLGRGLAGVVEGKVGRVNRLSMGKFRFRKVTTSFPENWNVSKQRSSEKGDRHGTVGADVLARFKVILDYHHGYVYLKKAAGFGDKFKFNAAGMNIMATGEELNAYHITEIIPKSSAEKAGLQIGDEIIAIDGKPAFFYSLTDVNTLFRSEFGKSLTLIIRRGKELHKKQIRLKKLL